MGQETGPYRILGRVCCGGFGRAAELAGVKVRALLVTLLLQANRAVSLDRIGQALWEGEPPRSATANIRSFVHRLRADLHDPAHLVSRAGGYELTVPPDGADHLRFERLAGAGRASLRAGDPAGAADLLGAALRQWHGDHAAAGVPRNGPLRSWLDHLDDERERVVEDLAEAYLELGESRAALRDLRNLLGSAPARSRGWALCMRAYQMTGELHHVADVYQQAEAAYERDLGVPLDSELERLYLRIMAERRTP
ncbi:winged helix-turn-helix domain-containing protein [Dactylosporangium aurantiacum]|uniref:Winged helix-turn-helix domain-containing protein n=1 Tax=Dactylosporangium aurantiacum TaxID=35754 RepID=A0A9Q9IG09_9ACTN|nr:BTAD domain-containing putative transcriptional regulator [Dactylosporangium aurantiacum]MDG6100909.1 BTAD domain-containing putative transcriptional regulator [Dactylosporangium aurantiacum]UWZ55036.1 winged helix-turn-helix domain-containing protein [Dactylosporangium aurantiacum]